MRHKLWFKLLVGYFLSVVFMFTALNTYGVDRIENKLLQEKKTSLYNEASSISSKYPLSLFTRSASPQRKSIALFTSDGGSWVII